MLPAGTALFVRARPPVLSHPQYHQKGAPATRNLRPVWPLLFEGCATLRVFRRRTFLLPSFTRHKFSGLQDRGPRLVLYRTWKTMYHTNLRTEISVQWYSIFPGQVDVVYSSYGRHSRIDFPLCRSDTRDGNYNFTFAR